MNAQTYYSLKTKPVAVVADGPHEIDADGAYDYSVCFLDHDGNEIDNTKAIWRCDSYNAEFPCYSTGYNAL